MHSRCHALDLASPQTNSISLWQCDPQCSSACAAAGGHLLSLDDACEIACERAFARVALQSHHCWQLIAQPAHHPSTQSLILTLPVHRRHLEANLIAVLYIALGRPHPFIPKLSWYHPSLPNFCRRLSSNSAIFIYNLLRYCATWEVNMDSCPRFCRA